MSEIVTVHTAADSRRRSCALAVLCFGALMITVDTSIVNVALPSISADLGFSAESLAWVVDAYLATFGGFLLLGGRLGDLFGHRRVFLLGIMLFSLASLGCGLAHSQWTLIGARAVQGLCGAIVSVLALSLIVSLFKGTSERAKAMSAYAFVSVSGGSIGLLLGGVLTSALGWHWIFLVNIPLGAGIYTLGLKCLPHDVDSPIGKRLDMAGAVTVTTALILAIYVIIDGNQAGWRSAQTLAGLASSSILLVAFVGIQARVRAPLMPLRLFRLRDLLVANITGILLAAGTFGWFFIYARYLQFVLKYDPLEVAVAYLPANLAGAVVSIAISPALVTRFGTRRPLAVGLLVATAGLAFLARAPMSASEAVDVFPGMILLGLGTGTANAPLMVGALNDVMSSDSGVASGIVRTTSLMGGSIGLSILGSIASGRTSHLLVSGVDPPLALQSGYQVALYLGAVFMAIAALLGTLLSSRRTPPVILR
jgi:EmrB/QacA subfamily drug resistance transporter